MKLTRDNKSSCEREVTLAPGESLPRGSSLSRVHVNRPLLVRSPLLRTTHLLVRTVFGDSPGIAWSESMVSRGIKFAIFCKSIGQVFYIFTYMGKTNVFLSKTANFKWP